MVEHVVALDNVGVVDATEDFDLAADLAADGFLVVAVYDFQRVQTTRRAVDDLVDGASGAAPDAV